jgi:hypothetical protein
MIKIFTVSRKLWVSIWLLIMILVLAACNNVDVEPGATTFQESTTDESVA